ncbi:unnamed protein product [Diamesa serratosioi]
MKCVLKFVKQNSSLDLPDIEILHNTGKKTVGRSLETQIESPNVSREHVVLKANFEERYVLIKFVGKSPASLNGFVIKSTEVYEARENDILQLLYNGEYNYLVTFLNTSDNGSTTKRKSENDIDTEFDNHIRKKIKVPTEATESKWEMIENGLCYMYTKKGVAGSNKVAAYDMDGTIIKTMSGNVFPKNIDDWQMLYSEVVGKLQALNKEGYKIVIFTNQAGITTKNTPIADIKKKIETIVARLSVPVQVFVATGYSLYRKPRIGMWKTLEENNCGIKIDKSKCLYVGDAAGRPENKIIKRKKDHSLADRLFAINLGLTFYTPEEHFLKAKTMAWNRPPFDPTTIEDSLSLLEPSSAKLKSKDLELIIMVGFPGSGKSYFSKEFLKKEGYEIINNDTLKSVQKCISVLETSLKDKKSCVIDNTNPDATSRKRFIDIAKKLDVSVRCFVMNSSYHHSKHNNMFRELTDPTHSKIPDVIINTYKSKYQEPDKKEGFTDIVKVNFVPKFSRKEHEELYKMHLIEK